MFSATILLTTNITTLKLTFQEENTRINFSRLKFFLKFLLISLLREKRNLSVVIFVAKLTFNISRIRKYLLTANFTWMV